jgi:hypothetical protein
MMLLHRGIPVKIIAAAGIVLLSSYGLAQGQSIAAAMQPFGLRQGMSLAQVREAVPTLKKAANAPMIHVTTEVPRQDFSTFDSYLLLIAPTAGLCKVVAPGKAIDPGVYGERIQRQADGLAEQITVAYAVQPKKEDSLRPGSAWTLPHEWILGLLEGDRNYRFTWDLAPESSSGAVALEAMASNPTSAYLRLTFEFENMKACQSELDSAAAGPSK